MFFLRHGLQGHQLRDRPGCTCVLCMQPPSGKGKHKPTCIGNVCMTVKRWFKALLRTNGQARYRPALCIAVHAVHASTRKREQQHATLLKPCATCSAASNAAKNGEINRDGSFKRKGGRELKRGGGKERGVGSHGYERREQKKSKGEL